MGDKVVAGTTKTLESYVLRDAERIDADSILLSVWDPNDVAVLTSAAPTGHPATGLYQYDLPVALSAPRGNWTYSWLAVVNGFELPPDEDFFTVIGPGELGDGSGRILTVEEVESFCKMSFDTAASVVCGDVIDDAQGVLEAWLGRPITVRAFTYDRVGSFGGSLWPVDAAEASWNSYIGSGGGAATRIYLPMTPVVSIDSVTIDGSAVDPSLYTVAGFGLADYTFSGSLLHVGYTAGLDGTTRDNYALKATVRRACVREMLHYANGTQGVLRINEPGYSADFVSPDALFTPSELRACLRFKHRQAR